MSLPIDRTAKSTLDTNLVNGNTSDAPAVKNSNDVVYNTIDELNAKVDGLVTTGTLSQASVTPVANKIAQRDANGDVVNALPRSNGQNPNLLFNPSARLGISGWTVASGGAWAPEFGNFAEGESFYSPTVAATGTFQVLKSTKIPLAATNKVTLSGEISTGNLTAGTAWIEIHALDASNVDLGQLPTTTVTFGKNLFTKVNVTFTAPANTASVFVQLVLGNTALGAAKFRNVKVEGGSIVTTFSDDNTINTSQYGSVLPLVQVLSGGNKIESGNATITTSAAIGNYSVTVTFPTSFSIAPVVIPSTNSNIPDSVGAATVWGTTATTVSLYIRQTDAVARSMTIPWVAIGS